MGKHKKKKKFKQKIRTDILNDQIQGEPKTAVIAQKPQLTINHPAVNNENIKSIKSDLKKIAVSMGLILVLLAVLIIANIKTPLITNLGDKLVKFAHIDK